MYIEHHSKNGVLSHLRGKKQTEIKQSILKETDYLPSNSNIGERVYHILNDLYKRPICPTCKINYLKYSSDGRYRNHCSIKCSSLDPIVQKKHKLTFESEYTELQRKGILQKRGESKINSFIPKMEKFLKSINLKLISQYTKSKHPSIFRCLKCKKEFICSYDVIQHGKRCPYCSKEKVQSKEEIEIYEYLKYILPNIEIIQNENQIIKNPKTNRELELDFYISEKKIAIEYDGLFWHSNLKVEKDYHLLKTNLCKEKDIQLIH
jgi:DNA-directed RNA polymerase subunit RPC12/RpoP